jgi:hypothetical protein
VSFRFLHCRKTRVCSTGSGKERTVTRTLEVPLTLSQLFASFPDRLGPQDLVGFPTLIAVLR